MSKGLTKEQSLKLYKFWEGNLDAFIDDCFSEYKTAETPPFHQEIFDTITKETRAAIAAPRGHAKSTICSVFYPLHSALFLKRRTIRIYSAASDLAEDFLRKIKYEIENNMVIKANFGDMKTKKWTESHIILKNGSSIQANGINSQTRGPRPDLIICDDIETDDSVASEDRRTNMREKIYKALLNSLSSDGQFIWIGTIISHLCLLQEALDDTSKPWAKHVFRAYIDNKEDDEHVLWPALYNHEWLQRKKAEVGSIFFASEYQNDPSVNENAAIKPHMIRKWTSIEDVPENLNCVITLDPAYSEDKLSDHKVACLIGTDARNNRYLLEVIRTKESINQYMSMVINLWYNNRHRCSDVGVPSKGTEKGFFNSFANEIARRNVAVPLCELDNAFTAIGGRVIRRKTDRIIAALQPLFEQGRYVIGSHMGFVSDELLSIGKSKHDDVTDCMAYAEQLLQNNFDIDENVPKVGRYGEPINDDDGDGLGGYWEEDLY